MAGLYIRALAGRRPFDSKLTLIDWNLTLSIVWRKQKVVMHTS